VEEVAKAAEVAGMGTSARSVSGTLTARPRDPIRSRRPRPARSQGPSLPAWRSCGARPMVLPIVRQLSPASRRLRASAC
jgi:hypothetical protein